MINFKISKGYKKYIRQKKAKIRREILNPEEQRTKIKELYIHISENQKSSKIGPNV